MPKDWILVIPQARDTDSSSQDRAGFPSHKDDLQPRSSETDKNTVRLRQGMVLLLYDRLSADLESEDPRDPPSDGFAARDDSGMDWNR